MDNYFPLHNHMLQKIERLKPRDPEAADAPADAPVEVPAPEPAEAPAELVAGHNHNNQRPTKAWAKREVNRICQEWEAQLEAAAACSKSTKEG